MLFRSPAIQRGVSLYSYQEKYYRGELSLDGCVAAAAATGVDGVEMVMPGDNVKMTVALIAPIAMEQGLRFAIREGGRTVGAGVVAKVLE